MKTIATTGAAGFLGSQICHALAAKGYRIIAVTRTGSKRRIHWKLPENSEHRQADVLDPPSLAKALQDADTVVHCAAVVSTSNNQRTHITAVNYTGTLNVFQTCQLLGIKNIVHISSVHAYANMRGKTLNRDSPLATTAKLPYPSSKAAAHQAAQDTIAHGNIQGCIVCPGGIYGPNDRKPSAVGSMVLDFANGKIPIAVNGGFWWCDVRDVASVIAQAVSHGENGETYFVPGEYAGLSKIAGAIAKHAGCAPPVTSVPHWVAIAGLPAIRAYAKTRRITPLYTRETLNLMRDCPASVDDANTRKHLDYSPRPMEQSIADTIDWFRNTGKIR